MEAGERAPDDPPEVEAGGGWAGALQAPTPQDPAQATQQPVQRDEGPSAPEALWDTVAAALARRRPYESPRQIVNALLVEQVRAEFAGQDVSKRLIRDMGTRQRQLRVLARRRSLLDDGGPK